MDAQELEDAQLWNEEEEDFFWPLLRNLGLGCLVLVLVVGGIGWGVWAYFH